MSAFLAGVCLGTLCGYGLRARMEAAERETKPLPVHRPQLQLVTGEEPASLAVQARR